MAQQTQTDHALSSARLAAQRLIAQLVPVEVDGTLQPDTRRVIRDERMSLQVAARLSDAADLRERTAEARRVAEMWGVL